MTILQHGVDTNWPRPPIVFGIVGLVLVALFIAGIVWLIAMVSRRPMAGRPVGLGCYPGGPWMGGSRALDELDTAYARGQLSREEYFQHRHDLTGWGSPAVPPPGFAGGPGPTGTSDPGDRAPFG